MKTFLSKEAIKAGEKRLAEIGERNRREREAAAHQRRPLTFTSSADLNCRQRHHRRAATAMLRR